MWWGTSPRTARRCTSRRRSRGSRASACPRSARRRSRSSIVVRVPDVLEREARRVRLHSRRRTLRLVHDQRRSRPASKAAGLLGERADAVGVDTGHGSLRSTPRGSQLTTLNSTRSEAGNDDRLCSRKSTPEPPGPPGFVKTSPSGCCAGRGEHHDGEVDRAERGFRVVDRHGDRRAAERGVAATDRPVHRRRGRVAAPGPAERRSPRRRREGTPSQPRGARGERGFSTRAWVALPIFPGRGRALAPTVTVSQGDRVGWRSGYSSAAVIPKSRRHPVGSNSSSTSSTVMTPSMRWSSSTTGAVERLKSDILRTIAWMSASARTVAGSCSAIDDELGPGGGLQEPHDRDRPGDPTFLVARVHRRQRLGRGVAAADRLERLAGRRRRREGTGSPGSSARPPVSGL